MKGTIVGRFPKTGSPNTWVIVIEPEDGSAYINEEMYEVTDKNELPNIGDEVELVPGSITWKLKD